jgi:putative DNA primase/helicase
VEKPPKSQALKYAKLGLPVVPLHTIVDGRCSCGSVDCASPGKHPRTSHGVKDATADRDQIKRWWAKWPDANIGLAPGRERDILVLDIDPRHGGDKRLRRLERKLGALPETVTAKTGGGGWHLFFKHPSFKVRKDTAGKLLGRGIDVLSDGCIVVAPPSRHASGRRYAWVKGKSFQDMEPAKVPRACSNRLRGNAANKLTRNNVKPQTPGRVPEGGRNNHLTKLAGVLQRSGTSPEAILAALRAENGAKCDPPLDVSEIRQIVKSIGRYAALGDGADAAEGLMQIVLDQHFKGGKHLLRGSDGRFWHYDGRLWRVVTDEWVSSKVLKIIQANPVKGQKTASLLNQVLTLLKAKLATENDPLAFVANPHPIINCANGELWIGEDGEVGLRSHKPNSYLRHCLDVEYDPQAKCPEYDRAVREIFSAADNPEQMVRHWNELAGYLIQSRRNIPLIIILLGRGDNGKTKLIETVTRLLGSALVYAQRVDELEKSRFTMGSLFGKYLLVDDDVRAGARLPDGILKTISEAKVVTGEFKYGPAFNFVVRTVPVLLCNNVPSLADLSHGMQRRLTVIPFERTFTGKDCDRFLFDRIWKSELPGVLNRALAGYRRVLKRQANFKPPLAVLNATNCWLQQANPLPAFIEAECTEKPGAKCTVKDFYAAYSHWTRSMGYTFTQTQQTVDRNLTNLGFATKKGNQGKMVIGLVLNKPSLSMLNSSPSTQYF